MRPMSTQSGSIEAEAQAFRAAFEKTRAEIAKAVVGQTETVDHLLIALMGRLWTVETVQKKPTSHPSMLFLK